MNLSSIKKPIAVTIAATIVVAMYFYLANMNPVTLPPIDSALPKTSADPTEQDAEILTASPDETPLPSEVKSRQVLERALPTKAEKNIREDTESDPDRELILAEENGFGLEIQFDTSAPPATADNMTAKPIGKYADQIDQQAIYKQAEADGLLEVKSDEDEHIPSDKNISLRPDDELAPEIDQHEILSKAILEGYQLPEVDPDSHPPTEINELHQPDGYYGDEIIPAM